MLRAWLIGIAVACCLSAVADEPVPLPDPIGIPAIRLPMLPSPSGPPAPQPVTTLAEDQWYIVESDVPLLVLASPIGFVSLTPEEGPLRIKGKFADGVDGRVETRTYSGKYLFTVEAIAKGTMELLIVPAGAVDDSTVLRRTLNVMGPRPPPLPPIPDPDDPVDPPVPPGPVTGPIRVLIIEETENRSSLPPSQLGVMLGSAVREYCDTHCSKGPDGVTPDFRMLDEDQNVNDPANPQPEWIKLAFAQPRGGVPFLTISNRTTGFAGPVPTTTAEMLALLKKYGGE